MVPSADYLSALATTMAGGDIPDLLYMPLIGPTAADLPQFLKSLEREGYLRFDALNLDCSGDLEPRPERKHKVLNAFVAHSNNLARHKCVSFTVD